MDALIVTRDVVLAVLVIAGICYQLAATAATVSLLRPRGGVSLSRAGAPAAALPPAPIWVMKPLHGAEPHLAADLAAVLAQDWPVSVTLVCGVQRADDPAIAVVEAVAARHPGRVRLVVDGSSHGGNAKVSNLINMARAAPPPDAAIVVLSDSDIGVPGDWLARIAAALAAPGVGAVTCLYHPRPGPGLAARFSAMGVAWGFLPSVCIGLSLGLARPCMGSTIALRAQTLAAIGGFAAFADVLADDHAIGAAVRRLGLRVAVPGFTVAHDAAERDFQALVAHELRWNLTLRQLDPAGFAGFALVNPLPFALLLLALAPVPAVLPLLLAALVVRGGVALTVARLTGAHAGSLLWLPLRDVLTLVLTLASFGRGTAAWRGARLSIAADGRIAA